MRNILGQNISNDTLFEIARQYDPDGVGIIVPHGFQGKSSHRRRPCGDPRTRCLRVETPGVSPPLPALRRTERPIPRQPPDDARPNEPLAHRQRQEWCLLFLHSTSFSFPWRFRGRITTATSIHVDSVTDELNDSRTKVVLRLVFLFPKPDLNTGVEILLNLQLRPERVTNGMPQRAAISTVYSWADNARLRNDLRRFQEWQMSGLYCCAESQGSKKGGEVRVGQGYCRKYIKYHYRPNVS